MDALIAFIAGIKASGSDHIRLHKFYGNSTAKQSDRVMYAGAVTNLVTGSIRIISDAVSITNHNYFPLVTETPTWVRTGTNRFFWVTTSTSAPMAISNGTIDIWNKTNQIDLRIYHGDTATIWIEPATHVIELV